MNAHPRTRIPRTRSPHLLRLLRAVATVVSASAAAVLLAAMPAHANAGTSLHVNVQSGLGSMSVCVSGTASVLGDFEVTIEGVRSNGTRISVSASGLNRTSWAPSCFTINKLGTSYGDFAVAFTFTSGIASADDNVAYGVGGWASGFNDLTIGSGS